MPSPLREMPLALTFPLRPPCTIRGVNRLRLRSAPQKTLCFLASDPSPCTIFKVDRLRLGSGKHKSFGFALSTSLALHYL